MDANVEVNGSPALEIRNPSGVSCFLNPYGESPQTHYTYGLDVRTVELGAINRVTMNFSGYPFSFDPADPTRLQALWRE